MLPNTYLHEHNQINILVIVYMKCINYTVRMFQSELQLVSLKGIRQGPAVLVLKHSQGRCVRSAR